MLVTTSRLHLQDLCARHQHTLTGTATLCPFGTSRPSVPQLRRYLMDEEAAPAGGASLRAQHMLLMGGYNDRLNALRGEIRKKNLRFGGTVVQTVDARLRSWQRRAHECEEADAAVFDLQAHV